MLDNRWHDTTTTGDGSLSLLHPDHGECFHSTSGALSEARTLYIELSGFIKTLEHPLNVLDVGLGLGYNALSTLAAWHEHPAPAHLSLTSLELEAALAHLLQTGTGAWQETWPNARRQWCQTLSPTGSRHLSAQLTHKSGAVATWQVFIGNAATLRLASPSTFDFIWQDPFSPDKNPTMWNTRWFQTLAQVARPGATLMTYSAARRVKEALLNGGWTWEKIAAVGGKRHWLKAQRL